ncbi:MAG: type II toxin-antitoxin system PemK/MazF family toxin [Alphaproteobacteria bacterium]|nr:type II toxin-antitoxin system PemK/MazF family toxin [Alphaproteobacteria bacterium]
MASSSLAYHRAFPVRSRDVRPPLRRRRRPRPLSGALRRGAGSARHRAAVEDRAGGRVRSSGLHGRGAVRAGRAPRGHCRPVVGVPPRVRGVHPRGGRRVPRGRRGRRRRRRRAARHPRELRSRLLRGVRGGLRRQPPRGRAARVSAIHRGDLHWVVLPRPGAGDRPHPHVVVQEDVLNHSRIDTVVVCALTTNLHRATEPGNVLLDEGEGDLPARSVVVVSQISTVRKDALGARIGRLGAARVDQILDGLRFQQRSGFSR